MTYMKHTFRVLSTTYDQGEGVFVVSPWNHWAFWYQLCLWATVWFV